MPRTRTRLATGLAAGVAATLLLAGCGGDETPAQQPSPSPTSESGDQEDDHGADHGDSHGDDKDDKDDKPLPQGPFVDITFEGDSVTPNGERVEAQLGKPLTLRISSDRPGELHVHSTPEKVIAFPQGQSERKLTIDQPGVVEVEDHETGKVLLQLEVR